MGYIKNTLVLLSLIFAATTSVQAQVNPALSEEFGADIEAARSIMSTERKILIMKEMQLSPAEAEAFWPLYDEYVLERRAIGDMRVKVITDYAANYQSMTNEKARQIANESLDYETKKLKVKKKYVKKFRKILTDIKVVRYFQLEGKLDAIVDFDLASQIPLME
ncbi:MAG: hypothetical protein ACR2QG_02380 [Gammaproteobacteria bacterium]